MPTKRAIWPDLVDCRAVFDSCTDSIARHADEDARIHFPTQKTIADVLYHKVR